MMNLAEIGKNHVKMTVSGIYWSSVLLQFGDGKNDILKTGNFRRGLLVIEFYDSAKFQRNE